MVFTQLDWKSATKVAGGMWHRATAAEMLSAFGHSAEAIFPELKLATKHLPEADALFEFEMTPAMLRARLEQHAEQRELLKGALARLVAAVDATLERQAVEVIVAARDARGVLAGQGDLLAGKAVQS